MTIRRQRDFIRIWCGQVVSNLGDGVHRIAVLWWTRQVTGSDAAVVLVALATVVPSLLAAPLAGWLVDRWPRRTLMVVSDATRLVVAALLAAMAAFGELQIPALIVLTAVAAVATALFDPAMYASVTMLVPEELRTTANSMIGGSSAVAGIVGPALGGVLIAVGGTAAALWFDAATFAVSLAALAISRIPRPEPVERDGSEGVWAGWHLVRRDASVRGLVIVAAGLNLCAAPVPVMLVGLAAGPLGLSGWGFGLLEACVPAGMLVGLVVAPRLASVRGIGLTGVVLSGLAIAAVGLITVAPWAAVWLLAAGAGVGVANAILPTRFQAGVEPSLQGRVFALAGAVSQVGRPVGLLLAAPLVAGLGVQAAIAVAGLALAGVGMLGRAGLVGEPRPVVNALDEAMI